MNDMRIALLIIKILLTVAFVAAGAAKLIGALMMVESYEVIGLGQWFRYLTGIIEVGGAVLLWIPRRQAWGAALLGATMVGAVLAHLVVLGMSTVAPSIVLGLLCAFVLWSHRKDFPVLSRWA
jgi:putative oxidoreductase